MAVEQRARATAPVGGTELHIVWYRSSGPEPSEPVCNGWRLVAAGPPSAP